VQVVVVPIDKPEELNVILGQSHFVKTVEDLHEALVGSGPHLRFGLAFCEASGKCLVRHSGNDAELVDLAVRNALEIGAGHSFIIFLREGYPLNVLNQLKQVPEVCKIYCASANSVEVVLAETDLGRGILGVETDEDIVERKALLRAIGYKL
jgi:adenosine/AMP kinase